MNRHQQHEVSEALTFPPTASRSVPRTPKDAEELPLLLHEINHRIGNLLAIIQAVAGQTEATTVEEYRANITARISGLGDFFDVIRRLDAGKIGLADLLEQTIDPYCAGGARAIFCGPDIGLDRRLALSLHLVVHELATNAMKYGALSSNCGLVKIVWYIRQVGGARKLALIWREAGGPAVKQPLRRGFGSRLITRALDGYGETLLDFPPAGVDCYLLINLDRDAAGIIHGE